MYLNYRDENYYDVVLDVVELFVDDESSLELVFDSINCEERKCVNKRENIL